MAPLIQTTLRKIMNKRQLSAIRSFRWHRFKGMTPMQARVKVLELFQDMQIANIAYLLG